MNRNTLVVVMLLVVAGAAHAQAPPPPPDDPIERELYPPEMIMGHGQLLGLQEKQRASIKSEVQKAQEKFFDHQWQMNEEREKMVALLRSVPIDEAKVLEQADKVMALERDIKRVHLALLIRLKNLLSPEQIAKLDEVRREEMRRNEQRRR
ncbi:MAG TPA: periplasmic heavy metal sensor [Thermoanaerobaculia bacterium]